MKAPAERMKAMRVRRQAGHLREVRLVLPDARAPAVRARVARAVARLDHADEAALTWIGSVAAFDEPATTSPR